MTLDFMCFTLIYHRRKTVGFWHSLTAIKALYLKGLYAIRKFESMR